MIRTVLVEDEPNALKSMILGINKYVPQIKLVGQATNVTSAKILIEKETPELVLLDIKLRESDAFQLLDSLVNITFEIVFITAFGEFKEKAFDYFALNYLQKPMDFERLKKILDSYQKRKTRTFSVEKYTYLKKLLSSNFKMLSIPSKNGHDMIAIEDIIWCGAEGNYTRIHLNNDRTLIASRSLKHYEDLLNGLGFFRIHRSVLLNLKYIYSVRENTIKLKNKQSLNISKRNQKGLMMLMKTLS